ncbi:hypothetical protein GQR60_19755 [Labilibaculum sp. A4]|uniref:WG repeat-containing protein n=1 Tax=Labilibaculum euxinus TaxID=2686357 RepID=UPI000F6186FA|nr:WG repeat-containing protein [Labilibaculum euxinus]MDQ1773071.1 WG repeat-containing protein [Labilibaculum euxinus]MWN78572.1 hypothetical protein [Labilibaculum euxinus]
MTITTTKRLTIIILLLLEMTVLYAQRFPYKDGEKWGVVSLTGSTKLGLIYDDISPFVYDNTSKNLARVKLNNKYGFIESRFCSVEIPIIYDDATSFNNGFAQVSKNGEKYVINEFGQKASNDSFTPSKITDVYYLPSELKVYTQKIKKENWPKFVDENNVIEAYKYTEYDSLYISINQDNSLRLHEGTWSFISGNYDSILVYKNYIFLAYNDNSISLYHREEGSKFGDFETDLNDVRFLLKKDNNKPVFMVKKDSLWGVWQPERLKNEYKYKTIEPCPESSNVLKVNLSNDSYGYILSTVGWEYFKE